MRIIKTAQYNQKTGTSKKSLKNKIYKIIAPITQKMYSDDYWQGVGLVWKAFDELGLDWDMTDNYYGSGQYDKTMPPERKTWKFEINFINERGRPNIMYGVLVAAGSGSVEEPLSRYDITVNMG